MNPMKEYKMAKGWAIFIYVAAPILIGLFSMPILLLLIPSWRTNETADFFWFAIPISLVLIALIVAGIADTIVSKVTLTEQSIDYKNILFSRSIPLNEIKGFRIDDNYLFIESKKPGITACEEEFGAYNPPGVSVKLNLPSAASMEVLFHAPLVVQACVFSKLSFDTRFGRALK